MERKKAMPTGLTPADNLTDWTHKKGAFLKTFERTVTNVQETCKKVGISRQTFYNWVETDDNFSKAVSDLRESMIDDTETELYKAIKSGNITAIIFTLKTRAKERGYVERQELTGAGGLPLNEQVTDDQLKRMASAVLNTKSIKIREPEVR